LRRLLCLALGAMLLLGGTGGTFAQGFPDRPIRLVVSFAAGGGSDVLTRAIGQRLSERLGQPVVVENRPGGNTIIGTEYVARSAPDGYTLGIAATPIAANPSLYANLPYDLGRDFTWITQLSSASLVLLVSNAVPATSLQDLIALARRQPGGLTYGSGGAGGSPHLATVLLERMGGITMVHVPYRGNAPAITDLMTGRLSMLVGDIPQVLPNIRAGQVRAIAVTTQDRSAALPDVPTIAASGLPGYQVSVWYGVFGPANVPANMVSILQAGFRNALNDPALRQQLAEWGVTPVGSTPEEFRAFVMAEAAKWADTVRNANIRLD